MKLGWNKNRGYRERISKETAWKILIGIMILSAGVIMASHFWLLR